MAVQLDRYRKLGLHDSFSQISNYPTACRELALILKLSYSKFPKTLQSLVFQDVLTAFRLLPRIQTQDAISAANTLRQSVESALPKQSKVLAVTEFKHAIVAHKRYSKARRCEEDLVELPQDILVHVFSFLDLQSLISASHVCRSWNAASNDSHLWQLIINLDWRSMFLKAYKGIPGKKPLSSARGFCKYCQTIVWASDMGNKASKLKCRCHQIKPISTRQVVQWMVGDNGSSDSDSDSDSSAYKLWAYPRRS